jgi:hypothetical protein
MNELIEELQRQAESCRALADEYRKQDEDRGWRLLLGQADAYEHAAALARQCLRESVHARFERDR